jgi:hypothetical protein
MLLGGVKEDHATPSGLYMAAKRTFHSGASSESTMTVSLLA